MLSLYLIIFYNKYHLLSYCPFYSYFEFVEHQTTFEAFPHTCTYLAITESSKEGVTVLVVCPPEGSHITLQ